ncbi:phasin family protein [Bosea sp. LC85]|uniref:phasin family protein n=1 Tax=Bosea sp. LC85 TaxID=1502851 RepID=UPI001378CBFC|nr:phasin family protein [Bosea sp. LC85]
MSAHNHKPTGDTTMHDLSNSLMEPWKNSMTVAVETNRLALDNFQKLSTLQMKMLRSCMDLGIERLKAASEIKDAEGLLAFQAGQIEATMSLSEKLIDEGKALADLSEGIMAECSKLTGEVIGQSSQPLRSQVPRKAA